MKKISALVGIAMIGLIGAFGANAQLQYGQTGETIANREPLAMPVPVSGGYFDPARSGNGQMLDVAANGYLFQTWFTYEADGQPSFFSLQGQLARTPGQFGCSIDITKYCHGQRVEWAQTGLTWRVTDSGTTPATTAMRLYKSVGGACPTCNQVRPRTEPDLKTGPVTLEFYGGIQKMTYQDNRTLVSQALLPFWRDEVIKKLTGPTGTRELSCWYESFPGGIEESLGSNKLTRGKCMARLGGAYLQTPAALEVFVIAPPSPAFSNDILDTRFSLPQYDPNTLIVDLNNPLEAPNFCAALFVGLKPPAVVLNGSRDVNGKCAIGSVGELFVAGDRAVIWNRSIYRNPNLNQPVRLNNSFGFDLTQGFQ